jgi:phenylacetate-CoA ligase
VINEVMSYHRELLKLTLEFRNILKMTERISSGEIRAYQRGLLTTLIQHAIAHVPYYSTRLGLLVRNSEVSLERWSDLPLLNRVDLQGDIRRFTARKLPPFVGVVHEDLSSGSTGRPIRYLHEDRHDVASAAQTDRMYGWWDLDGKKSLATFMSTYDESARAGTKQRRGWRIGVPDGGIRYINELMLDIDKQINWLKAVRPNYLFARGGTHIAELALNAEKRGTRLRFDRIISTGSAVSQEARRLARRVFKSEVADLYGASETGLVACQCPDCGLYHVCDETILMEVLREDGSPCEEGETGRVVLTPLYNFVMPLIRYEIGDYATRGPDQSRCGRGLSSLTSIVGRYRNVFVLKDGRVIHPYANARILGNHLSFRQLQIVQTEYDHIEIKYVPDDNAHIPNVAEIEKLMHQLLDTPIKVTLVPLDRFQPSPGGKFEETLSLVPRSSSAVH